MPDILQELADAADAVLNTTTDERRDPAVWFPRVDALKVAIRVARGGRRSDAPWDEVRDGTF